METAECRSTDCSITLLLIFKQTVELRGMDKAWCTLLFCALLAARASFAEYCSNPLDRCVSSEVCAIAYPEEFFNMQICGPDRDGRCCPMLSRCPNGCGRRHPAAIFRSQNPESFLKNLQKSPTPGNLTFGTTGMNGKKQPMDMPRISEIAILEGETPKLYRSMNDSKDVEKELKVAIDRNDTIKPERVQAPYLEKFEIGTNQTNERKADDTMSTRIAKRHLSMAPQVEFERELNGAYVLKPEDNRTDLYKKANFSTIFNRKYKKRRRFKRRSTLPPTSNVKEDHGSENRRLLAETTPDNFEVAIANKPKLRKKFRRFRNGGTARRIHFYRNSRRSKSHYLSASEDFFSSSNDFTNYITTGNSIAYQVQEAVLNFTDMPHSTSSRISSEPFVTNIDKTSEFAFGEKTSSMISSKVAPYGLSIISEQSTLKNQPATEAQNAVEQHTSSNSSSASVLEYKKFPSLEADSNKLNSSTIHSQSVPKIQELTIRNLSVSEILKLHEQSISSDNVAASEYKESSTLETVPRTTHLSTEDGLSAPESQLSATKSQPLTGTQGITKYSTSSSILSTSVTHKKISYLDTVSSTKTPSATDGESLSSMKSQSEIDTQHHPSSSNSTISVIWRKGIPFLETGSITKTASTTVGQSTSETQQSAICSQPMTETQQPAIDCESVTEIRQSNIKNQPEVDTQKSTEQHNSSSNSTISLEWRKGILSLETGSITKTASTTISQSTTETQESAISSQPVTETQQSTTKSKPVTETQLSTIKNQSVTETKQSTIKSELVTEAMESTEVQNSSEQYVSSYSLSALENKNTSSLEADSSVSKSPTEDIPTLSEMQESTVKSQPMLIKQNNPEQSNSNSSLTTLGILYKKLPSHEAILNSETSPTVVGQSVSEIDESTMSIQPVTETQESIEESSFSDILSTSEDENFSFLKTVTNVIKISTMDGESLSEIQELTVKNKHVTEIKKSFPQEDLPTVMTTDTGNNLNTSEYEKLSSLEVDSSTMKLFTINIHSGDGILESTIKSQSLTETQNATEQYISRDSLTTSEYEKSSSLEADSSTIKSFTLNDHSASEILKSIIGVQSMTEIQNIPEQKITSSISLASAVIHYKKLSPVDTTPSTKTSAPEGSQSASEIQNLRTNGLPAIETAGEADSSVLLDNFTTEESLKTSYIAEESSVYVDQNHPLSTLPSFRHSTVIYPTDNITSLKSLGLNLDIRRASNLTLNLARSEFENLTISTVKYPTSKSTETEYTAEDKQFDGDLSSDNAPQPLKRTYLMLFEQPSMTVEDSVTRAWDETQLRTHSNKTEFLETREGVTSELDDDTIANTSDFENRFTFPRKANKKEEEHPLKSNISTRSSYTSSASRIPLPEGASTKSEGMRITVTSPTRINTATNYLTRTDSDGNHSLWRGATYLMPETPSKEDPGRNSTYVSDDADLVTQSILSDYSNAAAGGNNSSGLPTVTGFGIELDLLDRFTSLSFSHKTFSSVTSDGIADRLQDGPASGFPPVLPSHPNSTGYRIVGGAVESEPWPWMVSIYRAADMNFICGGALIDARYVLSAAHCFIGPSYKLVASVGKLERIFDAKDGIPVDLIVVHEGFEEDCYCNDLALLALKEPVNATPIGVPMHDTALVGDETTLLGWGATAYRDQGDFPLGTRSLQKLSHYPIHSSKHCRQIYSQLLNLELPVEFEKQTLCAGIQNGSLDACLGDSGGPLMHQTKDNLWNLMGVVSFGYKCAIQGLYGTYTRTSHYHDWIWKQVDLLEEIRLRKDQVEGKTNSPSTVVTVTLKSL